MFDIDMLIREIPAHNSDIGGLAWHLHLHSTGTHRLMRPQSRTMKSSLLHAGLISFLGVFLTLNLKCQQISELSAVQAGLLVPILSARPPKDTNLTMDCLKSFSCFHDFQKSL